MRAQQKGNNIVYAEVTERLLCAVPEITGAYKKEQLKWGSEPIAPDVAYGLVFCGFLRQVVVEGTHEVGHSQSDIIRRSFQLIEELSLSADFSSRCITEVSVLESLLGKDDGDWQKFSPYFGKQTLDMALTLAERWNLSMEKRRL